MPSLDFHKTEERQSQSFVSSASSRLNSELSFPSEDVSTLQYFLGISLLAATVCCYLILLCFCVYMISKGLREIVRILKERLHGEPQDSKNLLSRKCSQSQPMSAIIEPKEFSKEYPRILGSSFLPLPTSDTDLHSPVLSTPVAILVTKPMQFNYNRT